MRISMIAAMATNRVIGKNNQLPWHLPADLHYFKKLTTGKPIIMGRKTYDSIGRPLPQRTNIILSRNTDFQASGCVTVSTPQAALLAASNADEVFVIGGEVIYRVFLPFADRIYLTEVAGEFIGDAYFPDLSGWEQVSKEEHPATASNPLGYAFIVLERTKV